MTNFIPEDITFDLDKGSTSAYIKDSKGIIRFVVSHIRLEEGISEEKYLVKVTETISQNEFRDIVRQFFAKDQENQSKVTFKKLITDYQTLVKLPLGPINPRDVFNDAVNYRKIDPDRCENCSFCVFDQPWETPCSHLSAMYLCACKKNIRQNAFTMELFCKYSKVEKMADKQDMIEVNPHCICDNFKRASD